MSENEWTTAMAKYDALIAELKRRNTALAQVLHMTERPAR